MSSSLRKSFLTLLTGLTILTAGATLPAAAWDGRDDGGRWGGHSERWRHDGWRSGGWGDDGWRHRPSWGGRRCWVEVRRIRVETPWGPRRRLVEERVCR